MTIKKHIPNTLTCGNLLCGCLAIVQVFEGNLVLAACLVGIALVLDFFDGFAARMLQVASPIGKDLDSLADMVTFGVVPGMMMIQLIWFALMNQCVVDGPAAVGWTIYPPLSAMSETRMNEPAAGYFYLKYIALIIPVFSCIRLAKFNNDTRQTDSFIGLNTPSNAMVICSFPLIMHYQPQFHFLTGAIGNPWFLIILSVVMSFLLISEIPFFALKVKNFSWADNKLRFVFVGLCVLLLLTLRFAAVPFIIILYILLSIVNNIFLKKKV